MPVRFQVDGDFYDHPKALGLSDTATALWVRAGSYSAAKLLDGFVPEDALALLTRTPEEASLELVRRGLWRRARGGFQFHQWAERNLTRERVEDYRAADRDRKRAERVTARVTHTATCHTCGHTYVTARSDSKYCSTRCRKQASRDGKDQAGTEVVRTESTSDSERNPDGIRPVSVYASESVSVSGSGRDAVPGKPPSGEPPPTKCPEHANDDDPPNCGRCGDARRANEAWKVAEAERARQQRLLQASQTAHQRAEATRIAIARCDRCDRLGQLANGRACNHQPEATPGAAAAARANIRPGPAGRQRVDPVALARQRAPESPLDAALAEVIPIRPTEMEEPA